MSCPDEMAGRTVLSILSWLGVGFTARLGTARTGVEFVELLLTATSWACGWSDSVTIAKGLATTGAGAGGAACG